MQFNKVPCRQYEKQRQQRAQKPSETIFEQGLHQLGSEVTKASPVRAGTMELEACGPSLAK
jgi:hypothetical protein